MAAPAVQQIDPDAATSRYDLKPLATSLEGLQGASSSTTPHVDLEPFAISPEELRAADQSVRRYAWPGSDTQHQDRHDVAISLQTLVDRQARGDPDRAVALVHMLANPQDRANQAETNSDILKEILYCLQHAQPGSSEEAYILHSLKVRCRVIAQPYLILWKRRIPTPWHVILLTGTPLELLEHLIATNTPLSSLHPLIHDVIRSITDGSNHGGLAAYLASDTALTFDMVHACGLFGRELHLRNQYEQELCSRFFDEAPCNIVTTYHAKIDPEWAARHAARIDTPVAQLHYLDAQQLKDATEEVHDLMEELAPLFDVAPELITSRMLLDALAACENAADIPAAALTWLHFMFGSHRFFTNPYNTPLSSTQPDLADAIWAAYASPDRILPLLEGRSPLALLLWCYTTEDIAAYLPIHGTPFDDHIIDACSNYLCTATAIAIAESEDAAPFTPSQLQLFFDGAVNIQDAWSALSNACQRRTMRRILDGLHQLDAQGCSYEVCTFAHLATPETRAEVELWCHEKLAAVVADLGLERELDVDLDAFAALICVVRPAPCALFASIVTRMRFLECDNGTIAHLIHQLSCALEVEYEVLNRAQPSTDLQDANTYEQLVELHMAVAITALRRVPNAPYISWCWLKYEHKCQLLHELQQDASIPRERFLMPIHSIFTDAEFEATHLEKENWMLVMSTLRACCEARWFTEPMRELAVWVVRALRCHQNRHFAAEAMDLAVACDGHVSHRCSLEELKVMAGLAVEDGTEQGAMWCAVMGLVKDKTRVRLLE